MTNEMHHPLRILSNYIKSADIGCPLIQSLGWHGRSFSSGFSGRLDQRFEALPMRPARILWNAAGKVLQDGLSATDHKLPEPSEPQLSQDVE